MADDLREKIVDELRAAGLYALTAGCAAVKFLAVNAAGIVDVHLVSVLDGAVGDLLGLGVLGHDAVDLRLHVLIAHVGGAGGQGNGGVIGGQRYVIQRGDAVNVAVFSQALAVIDALRAGGCAGRRAGGSRRAGGTGCACAAGRAGCGIAAGKQTGAERGSQGGADKFRCLFHGGLLNHSKTRQCRNVLIIHEFCVQGMDFSKKFADLRLFRMGSAIFTA